MWPTSHATRTPLSRSKGQRSTCRGRGHIEAKDDGGCSDSCTTEAISLAKLQSNRHHQQTNTQFFYRPDALPVAQPTVSEHWREKYHIPRNQLGVFQLCLWPLIACGCLVMECSVYMCDLCVCVNVCIERGVIAPASLCCGAGVNILAWEQRSYTQDWQQTASDRCWIPLNNTTHCRGDDSSTFCLM